jgi:transposase
MGGIMRDRGKLSQTVIVKRRFAATQNCPECGSKNKLTLEERRYTCG